MFRLGTTSYILPADILPNVHYLKDKVQDIELVLFEVDDGPNNLPTPEVVHELGELAAAHGLTYTVHLPLDLRLGANGDLGHISLLKARKVIECTRPLNPWAYLLHLDGKEFLAPLPVAEGPEVKEWQTQATRALEIVAAWAGAPELLAVENLEHYPLDFILPVLERVPVSRCVDVGHLWVDGHNPVPYLQAALPRTRVVHLHGLAERDHKSLAHMPAEKLDPVIATLLQENYSGVLTLEIFGDEDFHSSVAALQKSLERLNHSDPKNTKATQSSW